MGRELGREIGQEKDKERVGRLRLKAENKSMRGQSSGIDTAVKQYRIADLFAGIGGFRHAFESAGYRAVFSSEWDPHAQKTYQENFGHIPTGDIRNIKSSEIPSFDVLCAGFPCQPFSIAGVTKKNALGRPHGFKDESQGTLFFELIRILSEKKPEAFVLENVKNIMSHNGGKTLHRILEELESVGYRVKYGAINARTIVPQNRERLFIVGFRSKAAYDSFRFPLISDKNPRVSDLLEKRVDARYTLSDHLWKYLQAYKEKHQKAGHGFGFGMVDLKGVTRTLSARYFKDGSEILIPQRNKNPRRLTPRECARLMGFPENFKIVVSDTQAYRQFGNSVVVPVVHAIAIEMKKALDARTNRSSVRVNAQKSGISIRGRQARTAKLV